MVGVKSKVYAKSAEKYRQALHLKGVNKEKVEGFHRSESCGSIKDTAKGESNNTKVRRSMSHKSMNEESFDRAFWEQVRGERKLQQQCLSNNGSGSSDCSSVGSAALKGNPNNHKQFLGGLSEVDETEIVPESMSQVLIDSSVWEIPIRHGVNDSMADKPIMLASSPEKTLDRRPSSARRYSDNHLHVNPLQRSRSLGDIGVDEESDVQPKKVMGWPYIYQANKSYFAEKFSTRVLNDARSRFSTRNSPVPMETRIVSSPPPSMPSQESIFGSPLTDDEGT